MANQALDNRRYVYRPDLADSALRNQVQATRYVDGHTAQFASSTAIRKSPSDEAMMISQALAGESAQVFEHAGGWSWIQLQRDGYVGYVQTTALAEGISFANHVVTAPRALLFSEPDLKSPPIDCCFLGSEILLTPATGDYLQMANGGYVHERTVAPLGTTVSDFVGIAERFIGTTYLWGGKTADGIDCSGLVQIALHATGAACPRDSDMQMNELGTSIGTDKEIDHLQRGDLIFWDGHVGIMSNATTLLHANAWHMETALEPFTNAMNRIAADGKPVLDVRRLSLA